MEICSGGGPGGITISPDSSIIWPPVDIARDGAGGALVCWIDGRDTGEYYMDIYAQRLNANGSNCWANGGAVVYAGPDAQDSPLIVSDGAGGVIITWDDDRGAFNDIYAQRIDASGTVQWAPDPSAIYTARVYFNGTTDSDTPESPRAWFLAQNYPNPFNPTTSISFGLRESGHVDLRIYDVAGRLVRVLIDENRSAAVYNETWDGREMNGSESASGVYFCRLTATGFTETKKLILLR